MVLEILKDSRCARLDGKDLSLRVRAFDLLAYLHANSERIVSKAELLGAVWEGLMVEESYLNVQMSTLRKVLGRDIIKTVLGIGYRLTSGDPSLRTPPSGPTLPTIPSLVVLPFANLMQKDEQNYVVDGRCQRSPATATDTCVTGGSGISSSPSTRHPQSDQDRAAEHPDLRQ